MSQEALKRAREWLDPDEFSQGTLHSLAALLDSYAADKTAQLHMQIEGGARLAEMLACAIEHGAGPQDNGVTRLRQVARDLRQRKFTEKDLAFYLTCIDAHQSTETARTSEDK